VENGITLPILALLPADPGGSVGGAGRLRQAREALGIWRRRIGLGLSNHSVA
jgi:hypothetical protein